jgi:hypothetical protein
MSEDGRRETEAIVARWSVVGVRGTTSAFRRTLLALFGRAYAPNEIGDQIGELLLLALGKPLEDRWKNRSERARVSRWVTWGARHGFPPLPA